MTSAAQAMPVPLLTIGAVLDLLTSEFPDMDLSISKIRFLEAEGLVVPARTPSGYRKFSPADVDRLRYTLRMQRDHFLPLRVIREHLDKIDRGFEPVAVVDNQPRVPVSVPTAVIPVPDLEADESVQITFSDLVEETGLSVRALVDLEKMGVITRDAETEQFNADAVEICLVVGQLLGYGLEPKHMRSVVSAATNQADLVEGLIGARLASATGSNREQLRSDAQDVAIQLLRLQSISIRAQLSRSLAD